MEVKEAIKLAKDYIAAIFEDEGVINIGLEEIELRDETWEVTIGFSRRWDRASQNALSSLGVSFGAPVDRQMKRTYKIVEIVDESGKILGVQNREGIT